MQNKRVIIIGAGAAGMYAAAKLAKTNFDVTVLEKNEKPGGRCNYFEKDGHSFDTGPTILLMKDIFTNAFLDLGEHIEDYLDLKRVDPSHNIFFGDNSKLTLTSDVSIMEEQMENFESGSYKALKKYLKEGENNYIIAMNHLINREFNNLYGFINPINLHYLLKLKILRKHYNYISNFFKNHKLKEAFTYQDTYLGLNPLTAPSIFSMLPYLEIVDGMWYPKNGMYSIITALRKISEQLGVRFIFNAQVKKIDIHKNHVTGVTLLDGQKFASDIIVANADLSYVYNNLLPKSNETWRLNRKKYSCSTLMLYWGVKKQFKELATHNIFMTSNYKLNFKRVMQDLTLADDPSFYLHVPSRIDSSKAPINNDSVTVVIPVGHICEKNPQDWNEMLDKARTHVIKRISDIIGTDFKQYIKFEVTFTPNDWKEKYNLTKGSALGLGHNIFQMCYFRPKNRHHKYHNLYFVGSSTHPGSGVPSVLISAKLASSRILHDSKRNKEL